MSRTALYVSCLQCIQVRFVMERFVPMFVLQGKNPGVLTGGSLSTRCVLPPSYFICHLFVLSIPVF